MIYKILKRRSAIRSHMTNSTSNHLKDLAANQAHIFFVICLVFMCCHVLRVSLGIHEIFLMKTYRQPTQENCSDIKFSTLVAATVSTLLLTSNSAMNFAIYALMSRDFRQLLKKKLKAFKSFCHKSQEEKEEVEMAGGHKDLQNDLKQEIKIKNEAVSPNKQIACNESESYV